MKKRNLEIDVVPITQRVVMTPSESEVSEDDNSYRGMTQYSGEDVMRIGTQSSILEVHQSHLGFRMTEELMEIVIDGVVPFLFSPVYSEDGHPILTIGMFVLSVLNQHTNALLYHPDDFAEIQKYH
jgi:hypothetical protein